jgi:hypothetical protein
MMFIKITLLAVYPGTGPTEAASVDAMLESTSELFAEQLRAGDALTVAADYDSVESLSTDENADTDDLIDTLEQFFPAPALTLGSVPGVRVLGRNGTFKKAYLTRNGDRIELWLGTKEERFPLVSFPVGGDR